MAKSSLRLKLGSIYQKHSTDNYYFRYQFNGHRKCVSLNTKNREMALKKAEKLQPIVQATSTEVIAAHVKQARGLTIPEKNLSLTDIWNFYSHHPNRAIPATVFEYKMYQASLQEFIEFVGNPLSTVREITSETVDRFAQYLRESGIAVDTHNRKIRRIRKIFSTLNDFREGGNPFHSNILFRREREEQNLAVRRLAFTREQEQQLREVLDNDRFHMINKIEVRVVYYLGMYTGQRLKDCVLLQWNNIDLGRRMIWVKQFKTGKKVTIPIADPLLEALHTAQVWRSNAYVCPKMAQRYSRTDKIGKNTGNNLINIDVLRVIRWTGLETSVSVAGRKRRMTQYGFHSLRHTFASHCAEAGVPKAVLLSILGTDSDIADKYYTHIGEEAQMKAI